MFALPLSTREPLDHRVRVRRFHLQVGVAARALGPERVAIERVVGRGARLRGDRLRQLGAQRALREDRLDALLANQIGEVRQVLGVRLRLGRLRGDDSSDDLNPVAAREVVERVVVGDQLPIGGGNRVEAARNPTVENPELRLIGGGVGLKGALVLGVDRRELGRDLADGLLRIPRVVPPVRVVLGGLRTAGLAGQLHRDGSPEVDDLRVAA